MNTHQRFDAYRSQAAETAGPAQLVLMLFDGALARIESARSATAPERVHDQLLRLQAIVNELRVTLDHEQGGGVAANLEALYVWAEGQALEANLTKDLALLDPVESVLTELRDAWNQACVVGVERVGADTVGATGV